MAFGAEKRSVRVRWGAVAAAGLPLVPGTLARAAAFSAFDQLAQQERARGFRERSARGGTFFRQGQAGGWRRHFSAGDVENAIKSQRKAVELAPQYQIMRRQLAEFEKAKK